MIPITLEDDGTVKYANLYTPWYKYAAKRWANAVILVDNPSQSYKIGDTILEKDIESYFVWIPKYSYKIFDIGNYTDGYELSELKDSIDSAPSDPSALRHIIGNEMIIDIRFGKDENLTTIPTTTGVYYTHPAFTNFGVSGLWVGKFETGYNQGEVGKPINTSGWTGAQAVKNVIASDHIIVKPNINSWRSQNIGNIFKTAFNYKNILGKHNESLDPHMIKNTEWGAVAYLSHSAYGLGSEININNNSACVTGYSAAPGTDQRGGYPGEYGTKGTITQPYNTSVGYLASTTGNITGIYDMSGGTHEIVAGYADGYGVKTSYNIESGLSENDLNTYSKYFDKYSKGCTMTSFNCRILGDATGEMGPFYWYYNEDKGHRIHNAWYADWCGFVYDRLPWFHRGGNYGYGTNAGLFFFTSINEIGEKDGGSRLVLAVK